MLLTHLTGSFTLPGLASLGMVMVSVCGLRFVPVLSSIPSPGISLWRLRHCSLDDICFVNWLGVLSILADPIHKNRGCGFVASKST